MIPKKILFDKEARAKLAAGADKLAKAVVSTLGPRSRNVALNREYPAPLVVHDGVTVAREIRLKDAFEDMGATLVREAASKTNDLAGDGTTTATLLANTLLQEGMKVIAGDKASTFSTSDVNPMQLSEELLAAIPMICEKLDSLAKPINTRELYEQIATVSAGSAALGKLVADAIEKLGNEGVVMVEEGSTFETTLEFQEGTEFENGYLSGYFITDPRELVASYGKTYILFADYPLTDPEDLKPIVLKCAKENTPLLIIADSVSPAIIQALVFAKLQEGRPLVAVEAPEWGERRKQVLEDLAIMTGGNVASRDLGKTVQDMSIGDLGRARSIKVSQKSTIITPENPDSDEIKERIDTIKAQLENEENEFKKSKLQSRIGMLSQGVAVITVGGRSETEIKERKERVIDAVHATKAALAEGVIPGGGIALLQIAAEIFGESQATKVSNLIFNTLQAPFKTILSNAGEDYSDVLAQMRKQPYPHGYDVVSRKVVNMIDAGIIDPVKVTKLAVQHAFSVAAMMLTTDTLVANEEIKKEDA